MSIEAMTAVLQNSRAKGSARLVMVALAEHVNGQSVDWVVWPSVNRLAKLANIAPRNVMVHLSKLREMGEIIEVGRGPKGVIKYRLNPSANSRPTPDEIITPDEIVTPDEIIISTPDEIVTPPLMKSSYKPEKNRNIEPEEESPIIPFSDFDQFWELYPLKLAKQKAEKSFNKAIKGGVTAKVIIDGVLAFVEFENRKGTQRKYLPHPTTWLNGERWNDDYTTDHASTDHTNRKTTQSERLNAFGQAIWNEIEGNNNPGSTHRFDSGAAPIRLVSTTHP